MHPSTSIVPVSVDVSVSEVVTGIIEITGLLSCEGEIILFEYQTKNVRQQQSDVITLQFRIDDFREISIKGGTKVYLSPKRLVTVESMPGAQRNEVVFKVKRRHRKQAIALVSHLRHLLTAGLSGELESIPFRLPSTHLGLTEVRGILFLEEEFLVFEIASGLPGGTHKERQKIKVEVAALNAILYERGILRDTLMIRPKKYDLLSVMPGQHKEALRLSIRKQHREATEQLVYEINRQKTERSG